MDRCSNTGQLILARGELRYPDDLSSGGTTLSNLDPLGTRLKRKAEVSTPQTTTTTTTTTIPTTLDPIQTTKLLPKNLEKLNFKVNRVKVKIWNEMALEAGGFKLTKVTDYGIVKSNRLPSNMKRRKRQNNDARKEIKILSDQKRAGYTKQRLKDLEACTPKSGEKMKRKREKEDNLKENLEDSHVLKKLKL